MTKFLVTYHGAGAPRTDEEKQQAMTAFQAWVEQVGSALVVDLAAAAELLRDHPFVARGGTLQVSQAVSPA